jgi:hypothetical protein
VWRLKAKLTSKPPRDAACQALLLIITMGNRDLEQVNNDRRRRSRPNSVGDELDAAAKPLNLTLSEPNRAAVIISKRMEDAE